MTRAKLRAAAWSGRACGARFEAEIAERRDERSEPPAEPAVETPPRPTKRKADAADEKLARSVKAKVAEAAPQNHIPLGRRFG